MRLRLIAVVVVAMAITTSSAQVASHAPTAAPAATAGRLMQSDPVRVSDKPVARVNGTVLTERDLVREMFSIFPYARQHNGFPKGMEPEIRRGALEMIIFDELVYQEALRRKMTIAPERLNPAMAEVRKQFPTPDQYQEYLKQECKGSPSVLRQKVRRSLLIEALLNAEVRDKARVSLAQAKAYYEKHPQEFRRPESFNIQTISIIPPQKADPEVQKEARKRAEDALRQAKVTKSYREFGLLAEKLSDDDWHVNMGDRHAMDPAALPPPIVEAARKMKSGDVSDLLQFGSNYTLFRLNGHTPPGRIKFEDTKVQLRTKLENSKVNQCRAELNQRLHKNAKVELL